MGHAEPSCKHHLRYEFSLIFPINTYDVSFNAYILITKISQLIPRKHISVITKLSYECNAVLAEFFRGQLIVISVQSVFYSSALWFIGLEFSLLIGLIAGIVSFIPYLGVLVGIVIASIAAFLQFHEILPVMNQAIKKVSALATTLHVMDLINDLFLETAYIFLFI